MNYHEARQRSDKTGWAWTTMNDGQVWTSGGCVTWLDEGSRRGEPHAHPTKVEAERCFYEYEVSRLRPMNTDGARHCEHPDHLGDGPWTPTALMAHLLSGPTFLCDDHRDADGWRAVHPFVPDIAITASW